MAKPMATNAKDNFAVIVLASDGEVYTENYPKEYPALVRAQELVTALKEHVIVAHNRRTIIFENYGA